MASSSETKETPDETSMYEFEPGIRAVAQNIPWRDIEISQCLELARITEEPASTASETNYSNCA